MKSTIVRWIAGGILAVALMVPQLVATRVPVTFADEFTTPTPTMTQPNGGAGSGGGNGGM